MGASESHPLQRQYSTANFLARPLTAVESHDGATPGFAFGMACLQGWRAHMEDAHILHGCLFGLDGWSFFSVLDGHAGKMVAEESEKTLVPRVVLEVGSVRSSVQGIQDALRRAFIYHDLGLAQNFDVLRSRSGSTCTSVLISPTHVIFANLGDSRSMLARDGKLVFATSDHKPSNATEAKRIRAAGGTVLMDRVDGGLAVSRAFGDFEYKMRSDLSAVEQKVSPDPDTTAVPRIPGSEEFILLACDGVWDVMSNQVAIKFVHTVLKKHNFSKEGARLASEQLIQRCLSQGSRDNISAIVVALHPEQVKTPAPKEEDVLEDIAIALARSSIQSAVHAIVHSRGASVLPPIAVRARMVDAAMAAESDPAPNSHTPPAAAGAAAAEAGLGQAARVVERGQSMARMDTISEDSPSPSNTPTASGSLPQALANSAAVPPASAPEEATRSDEGQSDGEDNPTVVSV
jgi:serine/threonine protein phosphatase PrpC